MKLVSIKTTFTYYVERHPEWLHWELLASSNQLQHGKYLKDSPISKSKSCGVANFGATANILVPSEKPHQRKQSGITSEIIALIRKRQKLGWSNSNCIILTEISACTKIPHPLAVGSFNDRIRDSCSSRNYFCTKLILFYYDFVSTFWWKSPIAILKEGVEIRWQARLFHQINTSPIWMPFSKNFPNRQKKKIYQDEWNFTILLSCR